MVNHRMQELSMSMNLSGAVDVQNVFPETGSIGTQPDALSITQSQISNGSILLEDQCSPTYAQNGGVTRTVCTMSDLCPAGLPQLAAASHC